MRPTILEEDLDRALSDDLPWEALAGSHVLVTGASGFLGCHLVEALLALNDRGRVTRPLTVLALARSAERFAARFAHHEGRGDLRALIQDVSVPIRVEGPVDWIFHAASQASPRFYDVDPVGTLQANVLGTHHLLTLARERDARGLLFVSSGEVYGEVPPGRVPTPEDDYGYLDPTRVRSCYGESKRMGETMCACWSHQFGVRTVIARPYHTYGPGIDLADGRVFADLVADVLAGRDLVLTSDGSATRAFCYVSDAIAGFFTVLLRGEDARAYNVGNDEAELSILELAELLAGLSPGKTLTVVRGKRAKGSYSPSAISRSAPDVSRARALGWAPRISPAEGFGRMIASY